LVQLELQQKQQITQAQLFNRLAEKFAASKKFPFDFAVIDESQDITIAQLRFLSVLADDRPDGLFFTGDLGQRIFQQPFSWKALGIDIRGRSHTLRINYRTSHQIRHQADRLLDPELTDVDGNTEKRKGTISIFNGPSPVISVLQNVEKEIAAVADWLSARLEEGLLPHEIGIFVRSENELNRAVKAVQKHQIPFQILDKKPQPENGTLCIGTMHTAKGLEFRAVAVMACDDEVIPSQDRIETVTDESDLEDVYNTERHLLYVASTRARDELWVSGVEPGSEFLEDMGG
jgi:superfamily I DNA/RNA helicase